MSSAVTEYVVHTGPSRWAEQCPEAQGGIIPAGQPLSDVQVVMTCPTEGQ